MKLRNKCMLNIQSHIHLYIHTCTHMHLICMFKNMLTAIARWYLKDSSTVFSPVSVALVCTPKDAFPVVEDLLILGLFVVMIGGREGTGGCPLSSAVRSTAVSLSSGSGSLTIISVLFCSLLLLTTLGDRSICRGVGLVHTSSTSPLLLLTTVVASLITDDEVAGVVTIVWWGWSVNFIFFGRPRFFVEP